MRKVEDLRPAATIRMPKGIEAPSQGKSVGAVRPSQDAYQGPRTNPADPSPRKPAQ